VLIRTGPGRIRSETNSAPCR